MSFVALLHVMSEAYVGLLTTSVYTGLYLDIQIFLNGCKTIKATVAAAVGEFTNGFYFGLKVTRSASCLECSLSDVTDTFGQ